jgi:hypothetical protein
MTENALIEEYAMAKQHWKVTTQALSLPPPPVVYKPLLLAS